MVHPLPASLVLGVALVSLVLTVLALRAWRRRDNPKLLFVVAAFALFFVKGTLTAWSLFTGTIAHETLEVLLSGFDLLILMLLVTPFLLRR